MPPRVVRRGEESSSESDGDDNARDVAAREDAGANDAAPRNDDSGDAAVDTDDDADDGNSPKRGADGASTPRADRGIALSIIGHRDAPGARGAARGGSGRRDTPNTKLVARVVKALNAAPIARADAVARARERDLAILSQTSASMTCVNTCAREASLSVRETHAALRTLASRDAKHSDDAA